MKCINNKMYQQQLEEIKKQERQEGLQEGEKRGLDRGIIEKDAL